MVRNQEDPDWYMQQLFVFYATVGGNWLVYIYRTILRIWVFWYYAGSLFPPAYVIGGWSVGYLFTVRTAPIYIILNIATWSIINVARNANV